MKNSKIHKRILAVILIMLLAVPPGSFAQETVPAASTSQASVFKQEDLDQLLAPIALYPDSLVSQILMASTYPLEIVSADRWLKATAELSSQEQVTALEAQEWDPSVKSLINFPQVLDMMNAKLDWTQKLGDAFLAQQKDVMDTIQKLRQKAQEQGNLKTTPEQTVIVEQNPQVIIIEAANPEVVYVPVYNPTVVYGTWWYPSYPPYYYYPPSYPYASAAFTFAAGVAVGAAWGYAWGNCNWHGGDVDIDVNRNTNINNNIDRSKHASQYNRSGEAGKGSWKHDSSHRKGVSYRDQGTAQKYNRASTTDAAKSREAYRGRAEQGRQDIARGGADQFKGRQPSTMDQNRLSSQRPSAGTSDLASSRPSQKPSAATNDLSNNRSSQRSNSSSNNAFSGIDNGSSTRQSSNRGQQSLNSRSSGGSRSTGARSGSGGSHSGGSRGGGGRGGGRR